MNKIKEWFNKDEEDMKLLDWGLIILGTPIIMYALLIVAIQLTKWTI